MKTETILNAMILSRNLSAKPYAIRDRQYHAFRARILDDVERKDKAYRALLRQCREQIDELEKQDTRIAELEERREIIDVDKHHLWNINKELKARIADLEAEVDIRDKALDDSQVDLEMWRE